MNTVLKSTVTTTNYNRRRFYLLSIYARRRSGIEFSQNLRRACVCVYIYVFWRSGSTLTFINNNRRAKIFKRAFTTRRRGLEFKWRFIIIIERREKCVLSGETNFRRRFSRTVRNIYVYTKRFRPTENRRTRCDNNAVSGGVRSSGGPDRFP